MKRALVLLGAGASIEYGTPSTFDLTDAIERIVGVDPIMVGEGGDVAFQTIKARLGAYLTDPGTVNFEQIYHCAHELLWTYPPTAGAVDDYRPIMFPFLDNTTGLRKDAFRALCEKMVEIIFAQVSASCSSNTLGIKPLAHFIKGLRANYVTRVYTTNYDDFVLQAAPDLYTGFKTAQDGTRAFDLEGFWRRERADGVFHLHGSIHMGYPTPGGGYDINDIAWFDDRADALMRSAFSGGSPTRMDGTSILRTPIVTGLEKLSRVQQQPFSHYYSMMARDAMRADVLIVIGSGLADLHLNTWLAEARRRRPKIPLLFIDFWRNGYERDTYFENDAKTIRMFHRLQMHVTDRYRGTRHGNWLVAQDGTSAIWDRGFQAFLNAPDSYASILAMLNVGRRSSRTRRLVRRAYRIWSGHKV